MKPHHNPRHMKFEPQHSQGGVLNAGEYDRSQATIKTSQNANTEEVLPILKRYD